MQAPNVGALRSAMMQVLGAFWVGPAQTKQEIADWDPADGPIEFFVVPQVRPRMVSVEAGLQRVAITFGVDANIQHGTLLWKYMTQNTFRLS